VSDLFADHNPANIHFLADKREIDRFGALFEVLPHLHRSNRDGPLVYGQFFLDYRYNEFRAFFFWLTHWIARYFGLAALPTDLFPAVAHGSLPLVPLAVGIVPQVIGLKRLFDIVPVPPTVAIVRAGGVSVPVGWSIGLIRRSLHGTIARTEVAAEILFEGIHRSAFVKRLYIDVRASDRIANRLGTHSGVFLKSRPLL
jgi:hypothetical protein